MIITPAVGFRIRAISWLYVGQTTEEALVVCKKTRLPYKTDDGFHDGRPSGPGQSSLVQAQAACKEGPKTEKPQNAWHRTAASPVICCQVSSRETFLWKEEARIVA